MGISAAEYLGQRTDIDNPSIEPKLLRTKEPCPFMSSDCAKLKKGSKPVCSVRKTDGTFYIVCKDRLCATQRNIPRTQVIMPLSDHQINILHEVSKIIFYHNIQLPDVLVKREVSMPVTDRSAYSADFVMITEKNIELFRGPSKVVLEMQGGGETSDTKKLSNHVKAWEGEQERTNTLLREEVQIGTLETNAWRRQQEQFIVKGNIAMQTIKGCGMVFCMGSTIYDYLIEKVEGAGLRDLSGHNWTLALIGFSENANAPIVPGPVPLKVDTDRMLFTSYHAFIRALTDQGEPCPTLFSGEFEDLTRSRKKCCRPCFAIAFP